MLKGGLVGVVSSRKLKVSATFKTHVIDKDIQPHPCQPSVESATSKNFPFLDLRDDTAKILTRPYSNDMAYSLPLLRILSSFLFFLACVEALKFDIEAKSAGDRSRVRCIRNFVAKDTLVVATSTVDGYKGDGMKVDMHVSLRFVKLDWNTD